MAEEGTGWLVTGYRLVTKWLVVVVGFAALYSLRYVRLAIVTVGA